MRPSFSVGLFLCFFFSLSLWCLQWALISKGERERLAHSLPLSFFLHLSSPLFLPLSPSFFPSLSFCLSISSLYLSLSQPSTLLFNVNFSVGSHPAGEDRSQGQVWEVHAGAPGWHVPALLRRGEHPRGFRCDRAARQAMDTRWSHTGNKSHTHLFTTSTQSNTQKRTHTQRTHVQYYY